MVQGHRTTEGGKNKKKCVTLRKREEERDKRERDISNDEGRREKKEPCDDETRIERKGRVERRVIYSVHDGEGKREE
jgi:hypothetical protein